MSKEISKSLRCVLLRNGVEIWREQDRMEVLGESLIGSQKVGFIKVDGEIINAADITGIFTPETMDALTRRKNGQWRCVLGQWHDRGARCYCEDKQPKICVDCKKVNPDAFTLVVGGVRCSACDASR